MILHNFEPENPYLVSIVVITYNSSKYVLNTLESIKKQTYKNIELIITDDCSTDNTVDLCHDWVAIYEGRFIKNTIITSDKNTGISANLNRAIRVATGVWIKVIAGDDLLMSNCITDNTEYVNQYDDIYIVQSESLLIDENSHIIEKKKSKVKKRFKDNRITAKYQHKLSLFTSNINIQTLFIKRELYDLIGEYDETIPMMEDRPFYLKVLQHGFKIYYFPKTTAMYRVHSESVFNKSLEYKILNQNRLVPLEVSAKYVYPHLSRFGLCMHKYYAFVLRRFFKSKFNTRNKPNLIIWQILKTPYVMYCRFKIFSINLEIDYSYLKSQ